MNIFTRFRFKPRHAAAAPFAFVEGDVFVPGASVNAYEPTHGDPIYIEPAPFPEKTFTPLMAYQAGGLLWQDLSIPSFPLLGTPYGGVQNQGNLQPEDYPNDVQGSYYE